MSRMLKVMIVLLTIAAIATPVVGFAEDRLSLNGQLRVRGFMKDNNKDFNDVGDSATEYIDQRLRVGGTVAVAEGVAIKFRYDLWDNTWGTNTFNGYGAGIDGRSIGNDTNSKGLNDADNQAYLVITKDAFTLSAGDQAHALGNAIAIDTIGTGAVLDIPVGAATIQLAGFKVTEGATADDDDMDLYTLAAKHKTDMYDGSVFAGYLRDGAYAHGDEAATIMLLGAAADFNLDAAKVKFELNYFDGDDGVAGAAGQDFVGLQLYLDGSMAVSEMATVGAILTYAQGDDKDMQITELSDDGSFLPETYGFMQILYSIYPGSTFDPSGNGLGVMGLQLYTSLKLTDDFSVRASAMYAEVEEDYASGTVRTDAWEDFTTFVGSARYAVAANTNLDGVLSYTTVGTANSVTPDDDQLVAGFRLAVNF